MEKCRSRHRGVSGLGVREERASLGAGGLQPSSKRDGEATALRQRQRSGQVPRDLLHGNARPGQRGAKRAGARGPGLPNKAGTRGAWLLTTRSSCRPQRGLGGSAVSRPWGGDGDSGGGQGRRGKEKRGEEEEGERRLLDGHNLFGSASSNGRQRGRKWEAHALNHSLGGEGKEGGERATRLLPREQPPSLRSCSPRLPLLLLFSFLLLLRPPSPPWPAPRELSRERRAPTLLLPLWPRVRQVLDVFAAPDHAPRVHWGYQASEGQSTQLGVVAERSELLSRVSAVGKEVGFNSEMSGFCSEGWNCHQSSACCKCSAKDDERLWSLFASI